MSDSPAHRTRRPSDGLRPYALRSLSAKLQLLTDLKFESVSSTGTRIDDSVRFSGDGVARATPFTVTGALLQSAKDGAGLALSTSGAVSVTAVPEPSSLALALAALASVIFVSRRRRQG